MLEELVSSLLYEGYALYPYTPEAAKNATPTPFGIVYPPVYAAACAGAFDHARLECLAEPGAGATLTATLRFLAPSGERHEASEQRIALGPLGIGERATCEFPGGRLTVRSEPAEGGGGAVLVRSCVHNTTAVAPDLDRAGALAHALISTHVVLELSAGRFRSPLQSPRESVNIWPVLASPDDDVILGAAIALPDHPEISPRSHGNLFDNTEIEEALVLHVHSLTPEEQAASQDPVLRAMLERTLALTPAEIMGLHTGLEEVSGG